MPPVASTETLCLVNGVPASEVSVRDRGLAYGDGLFETLRVSRGEPTLADLHFARLERGAVALRLPLDVQLIRQEVFAMARQLGSGLIKLLVTRGESQRGYAMPAQPDITRILQMAPLPAYPPEHTTQGIRLHSCNTRLASQPLLAGIKHLNRLEQVLARSEWQDERYAEGLVCDMDGNPVEGTMSNIFVRLDNGWVTPSLIHCGVQGVMRDFLVDRLQAIGELVTLRTLSRAELLSASEIFCCNSVFGVWPVIELDGRQWASGPHTLVAQTLAERALN